MNPFSAKQIARLYRHPLANKRLVLRHLYWKIKSRFYYRYFFMRLGVGSVLYHPQFLCNTDCASIGEGVTILDGARIEVVRDPFGRVPILTIGDNTNIEQDVHLVCHSLISIGNEVSITARCSIVDVTHPYSNANQSKIGDQIVDEDSYVEIGDGVFIGIGTVVLPNVRIGKYAVIGANSVVTGDIPEYCVAAGAPARILRRYSPSVKS